MKKSFMTRALATGLSLAMAFSLSAATNVTTAEAASLMKASSKTVTEGKTAKAYMTSSMAKKYRIKSHKESTVAKKYISVAMMSSRKGLKITAKEGALAAANLEKKGVQVKINFVKASSAKAAKKATKIAKTATLKVVVKAKKAEKLTMTAEATAVKEITLTFNKAVADTTAVKVTVKKGNSTPTFTTKWSDDKKVATLAMDSKLTKGTYDITVAGADKSDLTASVTVEDQKLTSFELLSTNLVADKIPVSYGSISFKALDQYGKQMKVTGVTVTSSFGTLVDSKTKNNPQPLQNSQITTVSADGSTAAKFAVTPALAILGTKGNITIVDKSGVTLTSEITLVAPANPSKAENLGLYNVSKSKYMDMTAGDKVADYQLVLKLSDQYGTEITPADIMKDDMQITVSAGTTGLNSGLVATTQMDAVEIDGQKVFVVKFTSNASEVKAGNIQITVVNSKVGLLDTLNFTVAPGTVIKSFSVAADNDIYVGEDVELSYSAIDADGNEVTKYDTLKKAFGSDILNSFVTLKKQADGSAKLIFNMAKNHANAPSNTKDYKANMTQVLTFTVYPGESNIIVFNTTVKVNQAREIWEVTGVDSSKVIAANKGETLKFKPVDFKIADQYGNTMTKDQIKNAWTTGSISIAADGTNDWDLPSVDGAEDEIIFTVATTENAKFRVNAKQLGDHSDDGYVLTLSKVDTNKATDFAIEWKDSINTFNVSGAALDLNDGEQFTVVGKVGGKKVTIPEDQYEIIAGEKQDKNSDGSKDRIKKTATLQVVVTDADHKSHIISSDYIYSNEDSKLTKIESGDDKEIDVLGGLTIADLVQTADAKNAFKLKDQYGKLMTTAPGELSATISIIKGDGYVKFDGTNKAEVVQETGDGKATITEIVVTFTCGDLTKTETIKKTSAN